MGTNSSREHKEFEFETLNDKHSLSDNQLVDSPVDNSHSSEISKENKTHKTENCKVCVVTVLSIIFIVAQLYGAYVSKSTSILTTVNNMISDFSGFILSAIAAKLIIKKRNSKGRSRAKVLGSIGAIISVWGLTIWIFFQSISKLASQSYKDLNPTNMLITACVGLIFSLIMGAMVNGCGAEDDDNHDESNNRKVIKNSYDEENGISSGLNQQVDLNQDNGSKTVDNDSLKVRVMVTNIIGSMIQAIGVIILASVIYYVPSLKFLDPALALVFSLLAFFLTIPTTKSLVKVLMKENHKTMDMLQLRNDLKKLKGVIDIHDLHIWVLTSGKPLMSAHITCFENKDGISRDADLLSKKMGVDKPSIQVELAHQHHSDNCQHHTHR